MSNRCCARNAGPSVHTEDCKLNSENSPPALPLLRPPLDQLAQPLVQRLLILRHVADAGDSASYRADVPHAIVNAGKGEAVVFLVDIYR